MTVLNRKIVAHSGFSFEKLLLPFPFGYGLSLSGDRNLIDESLEERFGCFTVPAVHIALGNHAMCKNRDRKMLDVIGDDVIATIDRGEGLGCPVQTQSPPGTCSHIQCITLPRELHQIQKVVANRFCDPNLAGVLLHRENLLAAEYRLEAFHRFARAVVVENLKLFVAVWITERNTKEKTVQLTFGEGVGPFEFKRVLGCDHHERLR